MMSRCFSDCDESMRWVADALMISQRCVGKNIISQWWFDDVLMFFKNLNNAATMWRWLLMICDKSRGKNLIYIFQIVLIFYCTNFFFWDIFFSVFFSRWHKITLGKAGDWNKQIWFQKNMNFRSIESILLISRKY